MCEPEVGAQSEEFNNEDSDEFGCTSQQDDHPGESELSQAPIGGGTSAKEHQSYSRYPLRN